ncbi:MAG: hypothetical protein FJ304_21090, partial [Planctomycetes bacterium]|nr:hypothetical protein [Planctomycetota bacterium]
MTPRIVRRARALALLVAVAAGAALAPNSHGGDWPQFRGPNRDGKATDFKAPKKWPEALAQKWKVTVGDGVATPALVGDKLYVFSREAGAEVTRCLNADTGKEVWTDLSQMNASGNANRPCGHKVPPRRVVRNDFRTR